MSEFKIVRVSSAAPRAWSFKDKRTGADIPMETFKVMVEGEDEAIEINRKPGDKPHVGEVLNGELKDTEYGKQFKKAQQPFTPRSGSPKDEKAIQAMWAIGQSVVWLTNGTNGIGANVTDIEPLAKDLFGMVDRVKTGEPSGFAKAAAVAEKIKNKEDVQQAFGEDEFKEEPDNLDDIPF